MLLGQPKQPKNRQFKFFGASAFHCRYNSYEASRGKVYSTVDITPMEQMDFHKNKSKWFGHMERRTMYFWTYGKTFVLSLGHMERHYFGHMERHYVGHMERQTS